MQRERPRVSGNFNNIPSERRETTPYRNAQRENGARKVHVRKEFHCLCSRMEVERLGRQGEITRRSVGGTRRASCREIKKTEIIHQVRRERERGRGREREGLTVERDPDPG